MSEADLGKLTKSEIITNLLETLVRMSVELELEDLEDEDLETIEMILELITEATEISDYFTKLIKHEHKFTKKELRKLTPITKISNKFKRLIKSEEKVLEKKEEILKFIVPLIRSITRSNIGMELFYYEERFT